MPNCYTLFTYLLNVSQSSSYGMQCLDDAYSFLLHVEVVDDDADEEVEREEGTEDDEEDEV